MTMEALMADFSSVKAELKKLNAPLSTASEITQFLQRQLFPLFESMAEEVNEIDEVVSDIVEHTDDVLQPETAQVFLAVVMGGELLAAKLEALHAPATGKVMDAETAKQIAGFRTFSDLAKKTLDEITMPVPDDEADDDGDPDEDEDEDEDDDDDDGEPGDDDETEGDA